MLFECTVCGVGATVWTGSLFDCIGGEILLRHRLFESVSGKCNNGAVIARSIGVLVLMAVTAILPNSMSSLAVQ